MRKRIKASYSPEFLQWARSGRYRNPETGNQVKFDSLPDEEKRKIHERWMALVGNQLSFPTMEPKTEEDFDEFLEGYEDWSEPELLTYLRDNRIPYKAHTTPKDSKLITFNYSGEKYVGESDQNGEVSVQDADSFMDDVSFNGNVFDYIEEPNFNDEFWDYPAPVYHGTTEEAWEDIKENGLEPRSDSRGLTNKGTGAAVFTSLDTTVPENYGDVLLEIDTKAMKKDGILPYADREEPLIEADALEALASKIGLDNYYVDREEGLDPDTVVFHGPIPPKYISRVNNNVKTANKVAHMWLTAIVQTASKTNPKLL